MERRRKILLCVNGCLAFIFILYIGLVFLLPYLVNLEPIKEKILTVLFKQVPGRVEYQKIDLHYFPRPWVEVHQVNFSIHEKVAGTLKSVRVYPELLPILKGILRITEVQIESPNFTVQFPIEPEVNKGKFGATVLEQFKEITARASGMVPDLSLVVHGGKLKLAKGSQTLFSFLDIEASINGSSRDANIELSCRSNLWEKLSVEATINPVDLKGHGHIEVASFQPHLLPGFLPSDSPLNVTDSKLNLKMSFEAKGQGALLAVLEGSISQLTFGKGNEETVIRGKRFRCSFQMEGEKIEISLDRLNLEYPRLALSGKFMIDQKRPLVVMEVQGRELDVTSTREVALRLAGKIPVTRTIFGIVKGGRIPLITFQSRGRTMSDLGDEERFSIKGSILNGKISIPAEELKENGEDFTLEKTTGDIVISRGILEGRNLRTQWKNQQLQEGKLRVGLKGDNALFHLEIAAETDLSLLPPLLSRVAKDRASREEIARIRQIEGKATGRLVLGERLQSIRVKVDVQGLHLRARHDRIPYPVTIYRGAGSFDGEQLRLKNLSGKVGNSSFADLTAQIGFEKDPSLEILSGRSLISLNDLYPWLSSYEVLRDDLKKIQSVKGEVILSSMRLSGPLLRPGKWDFETAGELKDLIVSTSLLPEPFAVSSGRFSLSPEKMTIADLQTKFLHASLNVSGTLYPYLQGLEKAELDLSGQVTPKEIKWLLDLLQLELRTNVRVPFSISKAHLSWHKDERTSFTGDLKVKEGPQISLDIFHNLRQLQVNRLFIRDENSQANMTLALKERAISLTFSGQLSEKTLDKIFAGYQFEQGWVKGDFQAHIDIDQPIRSLVHGKIEGNHFSFPSRFEIPLEIGEISLNARGDRITIDRAHFAWGGKRLALSGDVSFSGNRALLDLDLSTENVDLNIDLNNLKEILSQGKKEKKDQDLSNLQIEGTIRFKSNSLKYGRFTWEPFRADIAIAQNGVEVKVEEAKLCGISTPGVVKVIDQELSLDIRPVFRSRELEPTVKCLLDQEIRATGNFDFRGRIFARGKPEDLFNSFRGDLELLAKDGRIYYAIGLSRILEFINVTEIYRGKLPDMQKEGLPYEIISVKGSLQNGTVIIKEATLDCPTLEMAGQGEIGLAEGKVNLTVLVAPLKTVDRIIKLMPLVNHIFAGTLVTIPVRVTGDLKDPKVNYISPSGVGSELLAMMKRTLGLPFKLVDPFMPRKKEESGEKR